MSTEKTADYLTWFDHGILDKTLWRLPRAVPSYLDDDEGAEWLRGYDSVEDVTNDRP